MASHGWWLASLGQGCVGKHLVAYLGESLPQRAIEAIARTHVAVGGVVLIKFRMADIGPNHLTRRFEQRHRETNLSVRAVGVHTK